MRGRRALLCAAAVLALCPWSADAATVEGLGDSEGFDIRVTDDRGQADRLILSESRSGTRFTIREKARPSTLRAGGACTLDAFGVVSCLLPDESPAASLDVYGGAGDDVVWVLTRGANATIDGGPGSDRLSYLESPEAFPVDLMGGAGNDVLQGSSRGDRLFGGSGHDRVSGGRGRDLISGDGGSERRHRGERLDDDVLDGGPGRDMGSWAERRTPVRVDLRTGVESGSGGERDVLRSIESVAGGDQADVLRGNRAPNRLLGRRGRDLLVGGGGNDILGAGVEGPDMGGAPVDHARDDLRCGSGDDRVSDPGLDPLPSSCERISASSRIALGGETIAVRPRRVGPRWLAFTVICDIQILDCRRRVILRARGVELGRSPTRVLKRSRAEVVVRLRRPLPARGVVSVHTEGADRDDGTLYPYRFAYRLSRGAPRRPR